MEYKRERVELQLSAKAHRNFVRAKNKSRRIRKSTKCYAFRTFSYSVFITHLAVTAVTTIIPPINAHLPGASPAKINTQTGFKRGSIAEMSEQASGGQEPTAIPKSMYGSPSWSIPKITTNKIELLSSVFSVKNTNGIPKIAVKR